MTRLMLLLAQAAVVPTPAVGDDCAASAREIVVCGRRTDQNRYRLPAPADQRAASPPRAEWGLGGGVKAGVGFSQSPLPQGAASPRLMATVTIPF